MTNLILGDAFSRCFARNRFPKKNHATHGDNGPRQPQSYASRRPSMDKTDSNAGCMEETGCDHKTDAIEDTVGTRRQFRTVGMSVGNRKEADNNWPSPST